MQSKAFRRKVGYLLAIAILFVPLAYLSAPAKDARSGGGKLTQMRREERLSQAELGKIDPASASMSLATLGMRGVAANQLWGLAYKYKKTENWDAFKATLNQIAKLQPNFVSVWQYQAWNVSYNVSVEFDNFEHRYHWVKKGVDYLNEGIEYNRDEPLLLWDMGWFFGHKMGRADEYVQFRRLFRNDEDFQAELPIDFTDPDKQGPDGRPDNWKVAHHYFVEAQRAVEKGKRLRSLGMGYWAEGKRVIGKKDTELRGKNPLIFHSDPPKSLINYADAIEEDGYLDEVGQLAWRDAGRAWNEYGDRPIVSSYGVRIRLNDRDRNAEEAARAEAALEEYTDDLEEVRQELVEEKRAALSEEERAALEKTPEERTDEDRKLVYEAERKLDVELIEVAKALPEEVQQEAMEYARQAAGAYEQVRIIDRYRDIVNYLYWRDRCDVEQLDKTIEARKLVMEADEAAADVRIEEAAEKYELAWDKWAEILDEYPILIDDVEGEILFEAVERYRQILGQMEQSFPPPGFKLMPLVKAYEDDVNYIAAPDNEGEVSNEAGEDETPQESQETNVETTDSPAVESPNETSDTEPVTEPEPKKEGAAEVESVESPDGVEGEPSDSPSPGEV